MIRGAGLAAALELGARLGRDSDSQAASSAALWLGGWTYMLRNAAGVAGRTQTICALLALSAVRRSTSPRRPNFVTVDLLEALQRPQRRPPQEPRPHDAERRRRPDARLGPRPPLRAGVAHLEHHGGKVGRPVWINQSRPRRQGSGLTNSKIFGDDAACWLFASTPRHRRGPARWSGDAGSSPLDGCTRHTG